MKIGNNTKSLKLTKDFRRLYRKGKSVAGGFVVVYALKNNKDHNRLGLTVSTSVGKATKRSRIKRLIRESYRQVEDRLSIGYDFVIVARNRSVDKTQEQIRRDMEFALKSLEVME